MTLNSSATCSNVCSIKKCLNEWNSGDFFSEVFTINFNSFESFYWSTANFLVLLNCYPNNFLNFERKLHQQKIN